MAQLCGPSINRREIRRISPGCAGRKEPVFQKPMVTVTPVLGQDLIGHDTNIYGHVSRQVANLQDQIVRDQLIAAGWTPPGASPHGCPEHANQIRILLAALERSSPHTDQHHSWKDEDWARQRAEAIAIARAALAEQSGTPTSSRSMCYTSCQTNEGSP